jgi:signal transduction histidine kinase
MPHRELLLPRMTPPNAQDDVPRVEGLLAILDAPLASGDLVGALAGMCEVVGKVTGASAVLMVAAGSADPVVAWGGSGDERARLAAVAREHGVWAAAPVVTRDGLTVVSTGTAGALAVAGLGALADLPEVRAAVRIAAERAGAALALADAHAHLDRTMGRILESDERLVGRIGLDIHDGPTQHLSVGLLEVQLLQAQLSDAVAAGVMLPEGLESSLERIYETLGGALTEMRELIGYQRPARFEGRRLSDILQDVVTTFEARSDIEVQFTTRGEFPVDGVSVTQRITFYRIFQEALSNAQRHGQATAVTASLAEDDAGTTLIVSDNGAGFDPSAFSQPVPASSIARFGLHGMRDRTTVLGGTFAITSQLGDGSTLRVWLPRWRPSDNDGA